MSDSVYEQINAKLAEVLLDGLELVYGTGGVFVERNRDAQWQKFPAVTVIDGDIEPLPESTGVADYITSPLIEGYVTAAESSDLGALRNNLYANCLKILKANRKLGTLAIDITEGSTEIGLSRTENQAPIAFFSLLVNVHFWTEEDDPFSIGPG